MTAGVTAGKTAKERVAKLVNATKVQQDGPNLLGANKLLHTGSTPVSFSVFFIG